MPITKAGDGPSPSYRLPDSIIEVLQKVFLLSSIITLALFGYLLFGLFSGQLADAGSRSAIDKQHALDLVSSLGTYLNGSLVLTLLLACVLFYDIEITGLIMLVLAGVLAYGLKFGMDYFGANHLIHPGGPSEHTLLLVQNIGYMIAVPGMLLFLYNLYTRIRDVRRGPDLAKMQFGQNAKKQNVPRAPIQAFAKCWQLPYCREGIRVKCPIFHARTKCWKERVGCMCEENIIHLAMGGEASVPTSLTKESGFIPMGDLIQKHDEANRKEIPTRPGPRGVRIPTNPHLTEGQKRDRCRNCVIYNEHQRQKYNLLSPLLTIAIPLFVILQFDPIKDWVSDRLRDLDALVSHVRFDQANVKTDAITANLGNSLFIQGFLVLLLTVFVLTWSLRLLEYCTFKIKI